MTAKRIDLVLYQGDTFERIVRWETKPFLWKAITAIPNTAPATLTVPTHGLTDGWRVAVVDVGGMLDINAKGRGLKDTDFVPCTYVDANTIALNEISAADFDAYTSGGYVKFYTPVDLTGFAAKLEIRAAPGDGTVLATISSLGGGITIDPTAKTILITIDRATTEAFSWTSAWYDLQMIDGSDKETTILHGTICVQEEVTV